MERIKNFFRENTVLCVVVLCVLCGFAGWLYADIHRNDGIHNNTDERLADIDRRMQSIEKGLDGLQKRIDENQKTISGTLERIERSRNNAQEIVGGLGTIEDRIDSAIQRTDRIEDIIGKTEERYRQGKTSL